MTQRERPSPDHGSLASARCNATTVSDRRRLGAETGGPLSPLLLTSSGTGSLWEQWYEQASPAQRQAVLAQAAEQGLLFAQQLPSPEGPAAASKRPLLTALLHGPAPELAPLRRSAEQAQHEFFDRDLDEVQRQAVLRALATPDLALVLGYPGSGKSRIIAEILRQAVKVNQRVLFVAVTSAAVDCVLSRLAEEPHLGILRCLASSESADHLPPAVAALTREQRLLHFEQQTLAAAQKAVDAASIQVQRFAREAPLWQQLDGCQEQQQGLRAAQREVEEKQAALDHLAGELERSDSALRSSWEPMAREHMEAIAPIDEQLDQVRRELDTAANEQKSRDSEQQQLVPLAEAKQGHRWWTTAWWRATLHGSRLVRLEQLQAESQLAEQRLQTLKTREKDLVNAKAEHESALAAKKKYLLESERERRASALAAEQQGLTGRMEQARQRWHELLLQLEPGTTPPATPDRDSVEAAHQAWAARSSQADQELRLRRHWLQALLDAAPGLPAHLAASARIVAAPLAALEGQQAGRQESAPTAPAFDLLIVEEAARLGDAELLAVSRCARRWLLVGEMPTDLPLQAPPPRRGGPPRPRPVQARPAFQRLWAQLHCDPRRLPVRWRFVDGRLVCALRPITAEQERWAQDEPVFDRPEIELRIVSPPRQEPVIAEVAFPGSTPIEQAKEFIYRELQELSVQATGPALHWSEGESTVTLEVGTGSDSSSVSVALEPGVTELLAFRSVGAREGDEAPWSTCALAFDRGAGWDRDRAERWVSERLGLLDSGRTTVLTRSYRCRAPLAHFLSELLYKGTWRPSCRAVGESSLLENLPAVELVPVDSPFDRGPLSRRLHEQEPRWSEPSGTASGIGTATLAPRLRTAKGGAGLEIDLADPRRREIIPAEVRSSLPAQGVVNLAEARAIVQTLEAMVGDPAVPGGACSGTANPTVAVMSLFPAQVALLRSMIQRSSVLSGARISIQVGLPAAFHQREALVALLSLTRSHVSRAVPFSDAPQGLLLALTRARSRLVLFGDPGTMARRSQWHGGLDHLDEITGPLEQALIAQLLGRLSECDGPRRAHTGSSRESTSI
jgi:hypothetical protein